MKNNIFKAIGDSFGKIGHKVLFGVQKRSPELLLIGSGVGVVVGTVMACKATLKVEDILATHADTMDKIHTVADKNLDDYTAQDAKKDTTICFVKTALKIGKLYAPSALIFACSFGMALGAHRIITKRAAGFAAALAAVDKGFKEYRERVIEKYGKEVDEALRFGYIGKTEVENTVTDENGEEKTVTESVDIVKEDESMYMRYITKTNQEVWSRSEAALEHLLTMKQAVLNNLLKAKGRVTLNEAYHELGLKECADGMVVGWVCEPNNPVGDNYIQFTVKKVMLLNERGKNELAYAIDFNVDGNIYDRLKKKELGR